MKWGFKSEPQASGACITCTVDCAEVAREEPSLCPGPVPVLPQLLLLPWLLSDSSPVFLPVSSWNPRWTHQSMGYTELGNLKRVTCTGSLGLE